MKNIDKDRLQMYVSIVRITIVLCWLSLFAFWIVKIFCNEIFEIAVQNENFIKFSDLLQNTWLKYLVSLITIGTSFFLMYCAVIQHFFPKGKYAIECVLSVLAIWVSVNFVNIEIIEMFIGYVLITVWGIIHQKKFKKLLGILAVVLDFAFTTISMVTRNIELTVTTNYLVLLILLIDVYIMFCLYYLYSNLIKLKKEQ